MDQEFKEKLDEVKEKLEKKSDKLDVKVDALLDKVIKNDVETKIDELLTKAQKSKYTWAIVTGVLVAGGFIIYLLLT